VAATLRMRRAEEVARDTGEQSGRYSDDAVTSQNLPLSMNGSGDGFGGCHAAGGTQEETPVQGTTLLRTGDRLHHCVGSALIRTVLIDWNQFARPQFDVRATRIIGARARFAEARCAVAAPSCNCRSVDELGGANDSAK